MTDINLAHIYVILDRSGSMASTKTDMERGLDAFFDGQRELPGHVKVSLFQFDDTYEVVYENRDLAKVKHHKIDPRGSTALLDAIGRSFDRVGAQLATMDDAERPALVQWLIVTDGQENASHEYGISRISEMIKTQRDDYQWQIEFLGSNQDAIATAASFGIDASNALTYAGGGVNALIASGGKFGALRTNVAGGQSVAAAAAAVADYYTDEVRADAIKPDETDEE